MATSRYLFLSFTMLVCGLFVSGCSLMPKAGPSKKIITAAVEDDGGGLVLRQVDDALTRTLVERKRVRPFGDVFGATPQARYLAHPGDLLEISIWETPPSMLFGTLALDPTSGSLTSRAETLPVQMVMEDGQITIPFAGRIKVQGLTLGEIEKEIVKRLAGQANAPQVLVRTIESQGAVVTVLGDVHKSLRLPLSPKGEKLLDAIALAGGVTQDVSRMSVQLSRNTLTASMPLDLLIQDPRQNIPLLPEDVITALYQPQSFSILGAVAKNEEIPFEAKGISLAQALARAGGLLDARADPGGVFVFRFEEAALAGTHPDIRPAADGTVPVIYQIDFANPSAFFVTQNFPVQDRDVIYVANMPAAELEKFLRMVGTVLSPTATSMRLITDVAK